MEKKNLKWIKIKAKRKVNKNLQMKKKTYRISSSLEKESKLMNFSQIKVSLYIFPLDLSPS